MNNTFDLNRFLLQLKRQWLDFGKIYLGTLVVLIGLLSALYLYFMPSRGSNLYYYNNSVLILSFRYGLFFFFGFFFISIIASSYYSNLGQKPKAIIELMTPASTFEKFLAGIWYTAIVAIPSYLLVFYIVDVAFVKYLNSILPELSATIDKKLEIKPVDTLYAQVMGDENDWHNVKYFGMFPFLVTSTFLLGSAYFNRFHYIKTAIVVIIFCTLAGFTVFKTGNILMKDMVNTSVASKDEMVLQWVIATTTLTTLALLFITYIRLKEKEV